jgi:hypothetical protein
MVHKKPNPTAEKEAQARFEAALMGALKTPHKPLNQLDSKRGKRKGRGKIPKKA